MYRRCIMMSDSVFCGQNTARRAGVSTSRRRSVRGFGLDGRQRKLGTMPRLAVKTAGPLSAACLTAITKPLGLPGIEGSPPTGVEGPAGVFRLSSQVMPCQSESLLHGAALPDGSQGSQAGRHRTGVSSGCGPRRASWEQTDCDPDDGFAGGKLARLGSAWGRYASPVSGPSPQ